MRAPSRPPVVQVCVRSGQCFCPSCTPRRDRNCEGRGTPLPLCAEGLLLAGRGTRHWLRWTFLWEQG